jgi:hypothetical protein
MSAPKLYVFLKFRHMVRALFALQQLLLFVLPHSWPESEVRYFTCQPP